MATSRTRRKSRTVLDDWRKARATVKRHAARLRRARDRTRRLRSRAGAGWLRLTGDYVCSICGQKFRLIDKENHAKAHAVFGHTKRKNVVENKAHQERQRSKVVEAEMARRAQQVAARSGNADPPKPTRPPTVAERIRKAWGHQIDQRGAVMAGTAAPKSPSQTRNVANGPAAGLLAAAQAFTDAEPHDHEEMRDLMLAFHSAMETFARGVESFQERQVNRGFHPATMRPLDIATNGIGDGATGFTQTLVAIERFYAANFEAAQNPGPGEQFFGATPVGKPAANGRPRKTAAETKPANA